MIGKTINSIIPEQQPWYPELKGDFDCRPRQHHGCCSHCFVPGQDPMQKTSTSASLQMSYILKVLFSGQLKQLSSCSVHGCDSPHAFLRPGLPYRCNAGFLQKFPMGWGSRCFARATCDFLAAFCWPSPHRWTLCMPPKIKRWGRKICSYPWLPLAGARPETVCQSSFMNSPPCLKSCWERWLSSAKRWH